MILKSITTPDGTLTYATIEQAIEAGATKRAIADALASQHLASVAALATTMRTQVVSTDPAKLQEYAIKEAIAVAPDQASEAEIALLTAEAAARGLELDELFAVIKSRAADLRKAALNIAVWEATAKAQLTNLPAKSKDPLADLDNVLAITREYADALMTALAQDAMASQSASQSASQTRSQTQK